MLQPLKFSKCRFGGKILPSFGDDLYLFVVVVGLSAFDVHRLYRHGFSLFFLIPDPTLLSAYSMSCADRLMLYFCAHNCVNVPGHRGFVTWYSVEGH